MMARSGVGAVVNTQVSRGEKVQMPKLISSITSETVFLSTVRAENMKVFRGKSNHSPAQQTKRDSSK